MSKDSFFPVCGFIGLGSQGAPIANRMIAAGLPTVLWARRNQTLKPFRNTGASFCENIADLGRQVDHVGICVVGDDGVTEVCGELLPAMRAGSRVAIHSTILPATCQELADQAQQHGVHLIDAAVSGGKPAADTGTLTLMLGGDPEIIDLMRPVLSTFSSLMIHLGDVGAGQQAKLINNSLMVANMGLAHRAVTSGVELGLDREALLQLLQSSSAGSFALDVYAKRADIQSFDRAETLFEKVHLLGEILGKGHPTFRVLLDAANSLRQPRDDQGRRDE